MKSVHVGWMMLLLIILGLSNNPVQAQSCTAEMARRVAYNFCIQEGKGALVASENKLSPVAEVADIHGIYAFNLPDNAGFVIVAGDQRLHPIIGYSFESPFRNVGDNVRSWLTNCERLVHIAQRIRITTEPQVAAEWDLLEDDPEPMDMASSGIPALMATRWNQSPLYNDSCPYDATAHTRVVTGCVATAMAQVMAYWHRPLIGNGSHSYTHELYGLQSANFGATSYDWQHMPYTLDASSSAAEIRAEAQLVYHCGVAVEMGYGVGGSSAFVSSYGDTIFPSAENALRDYFRFKPSLHCVYEDNMTSMQWLDTIKNEIFCGRPIVFAGYQSSGGHAYVVDGYDAFNRVHVNWGWGGFCDGFYTLTPLPMYSAGCQAIIGIEPDGILYGNKSFLNVDENGVDDTMNVFTNNLNNASWIAYANRTWISVSPNSGVGGGAQAQIVIHVDSNATGENRSGNVIVRQGSDSINIAIVQYGYHGEDQVLPEDDTIYMDSMYYNEIRVDTIYPGVHYAIMDPGGNGPYPSPCNSRHHLVSAQRTNLIMEVNYDIEPGSDWLRIYDSEGEGVQLTNYSGCDSNLRVVCYSGHAFINFHADGYNPRSGYIINVYACDTFEAEVRNVVSVVTGTNTITLSWIDTSEADQWRIKWGTNYRNLDRYREVIEPTARFTDLDLDSYQYYFRIYNNAGAADTGNLCLSRLCAGIPDQSDGCPGSSIRNPEIIQLLNHSATLRWQDISISDSMPLQWHVRYGTRRDSLNRVAYTDTNVVRLDSLNNSTTYYYRIYNNTVSTDSASRCFLMNIGQFTTLDCLWDSMDIRDVVVNNVTGHGADISWNDYGGGTQWTLRLFKADTVLEFQTDTTFVHIDSLYRGTYYDFVIYNNTGQTDTTECQQHHSLQTLCDEEVEPCVDFTDLSSCLVEAWSGYYTNPRIWLGSTDYGIDDPSSRHTVVHTQATDSLTGNALMMIPPGETASVRLGNPSANYQAEAISYLYQIDTTQYDLLILKYAAVLENPNHTPEEQPRFTLRIVDEFNNPIDDSCYYFDFVSDSSLGWNVYNHILWKDWTTVGVDLSPLHGRRIRVELTTYDCNQGNHFGYAYFVLKCMNKEIIADMCGSSIHNVFHVPEGFSYRWYEVSQPTVTLSTSSSLTVDTTGDFRCVISPLGSTGNRCSFEMRCQSGYRFPHSLLSYTLGDSVDCHQRFHFVNQSEVTSDEEHLHPIGESIENVMWDFGDGTVSYEENPSHDFFHGQHTVTLYSFLSGGACVDTMVLALDVGPVCPAPDTVVRTICEGDTVDFYGQILSEAGIYDYHDGLWWHTLLLNVNPNTSAEIADTIVQNQLPYTFLDTVITLAQLGEAESSSAFNARFVIDNIYGCDSVVDFSLIVWRNKESFADTTICSETLPFEWNGLSLDGPGNLTAVLSTSHGADSTAHISLSLYANPVAAMEISPSIVNINNYREVMLRDMSTGSVDRVWYLPDVVETLANWTYSYPIPEDSVEVMMVAETSNGCHDTVTDKIYYRNSSIYAPNAFYPGSTDGSDNSPYNNGRFTIVGNNITDLKVSIYNRWGLLVYAWEGLDGSWDGTLHGIPCPQGAYVWVATYRTLDAPRTLKNARGTVLLLY
ncbi:MAG: C10 family peptidase [Bacteroidales bacterium]|nr:C10 family peptidase [Bacteroidales bacterium]